MSMRHWVLGIITGLIAVAGCRQPQSTSVVKKPGGASGELKVCFITNNPEEFWKLAHAGVDRAAKDMGVKAEFRMPAHATADEQRQIIEDLITQGYEHFAVSPNDAKNQGAYYDNKVKEGITIITVDNDLMAGSKRLCFLGTNNFEAGRSAGELVKKAVPNGGKIAIFVGKLDNLNAPERRNGVIAALAGLKSMEEAEELVNKGYPVKAGNYEILDTLTDNTDRPTCKRNAETIMTKHPDVVCMVGLWAYNAEQIMLAAKDQGMRGKIKIVSFDEEKQTLDGIRSGEIVGTIVQQPYEFGYRSIKTLVDVARGNKSTLPPGGIGYIEHQVIDKTNVDAFEKKLNELRGK